MEKLKNEQITSLKQEYPDLNLMTAVIQYPDLIKNADVKEEYRFSLKLPVSKTPLFIRISLNTLFPLT